MPDRSRIKIYLYQWSTFAELIESKVLSEVMANLEEWVLEESGEDDTGQYVIFGPSSGIFKLKGLKDA